MLIEKLSKLNELSLNIFVKTYDYTKYGRWITKKYK